MNPPLKEWALVTEAVRIAVRAHGDKREDKGARQPRILHALRVLDLVQHAAERRDEPTPFEAMAVAVLHDVIEDAAWEPHHLLANGMPETVVAGVEAITRKEGQEYQAEYIEQQVAGNALAVDAKLADLHDNLRPTRVAQLGGGMTTLECATAGCPACRESVKQAHAISSHEVRLHEQAQCARSRGSLTTRYERAHKFLLEVKLRDGYVKFVRGEGL